MQERIEQRQHREAEARGRQEIDPVGVHFDPWPDG